MFLAGHEEGDRRRCGAYRPQEVGSGEGTTLFGGVRPGGLGGLTESHERHQPHEFARPGQGQARTGESRSGDRPDTQRWFPMAAAVAPPLGRVRSRKLPALEKPTDEEVRQKVPVSSQLGAGRN